MELLSGRVILCLGKSKVNNRRGSDSSVRWAALKRLYSWSGWFWRRVKASRPTWHWEEMHGGAGRGVGE